jgi:hypothetical protein
MKEQPHNPYDYPNDYLNQYGITDSDGFRKSQKRNQDIYEKVLLTAYQNLTGSNKTNKIKKRIDFPEENL